MVSRATGTFTHIFSFMRSLRLLQENRIKLMLANGKTMLKKKQAKATV